VPYLLKVICAISAMSEPTGPHGSLLVAGKISACHSLARLEETLPLRTLTSTWE
jgi:hypothetical protein